MNRAHGSYGPLFGREEERQTLSALLREPATRALTLIGPAGVGKSRLARAVAEEGRWPGGVQVCALAGARGAEDLLHNLGVCLGLELGADPVARVSEALARREGELLVLDDADSLGPDARPLLERWLRDAPGVQLLITSRAPMGLPTERTFALAPLPTLPEGAATEAVLESAAVRLLVSRAEEAGARLDRSPEGVAELSALARALDGLPLALELAAPRLRTLSPRALQARVTSASGAVNPALLVDRRRPERQGTLAAAIELSWDGLSRHEQTAFAQLSVFRGMISTAAAEAVLRCGRDAPPAAALLESLVEKSLLQHVLMGHYAMLLTLRGFAEEYLINPGPTEARHGAWFAELGGESLVDALAGCDGSAALSRAVYGLEDLRVAARRARERGDDAVATGASVGAAGALLAAGPVQAVLPLVDEALPGAADGWGAAALLYARASALRHLGRLDEAMRTSEEALQRCEADDAPDLRELLRALRAILLRLLGRSEEALREVELGLASSPLPLRRLRLEVQRLDLARERGAPVIDGYTHLLEEARDLPDAGLISTIANNLGVALLDAQRLAEARSAFQVALDASLLGSVSFRTVIPLCNLGHASRLLGDREAARRHLDRAITLARESGVPSSELQARAYLALVDLDDGEPERARAGLQGAAELARRSRQPRLLGNVLGQLALCALDLGDSAGAREHLYQALQLHDQTGNLRWSVWTRALLTHLALDEGAVAEAEAQVQVADARAAGAGPWAEGVLGVAKARLLLARGDPEALAVAEQAVGALTRGRAELAEILFAEMVLGQARLRTGDEAGVRALIVQLRARMAQGRVHRSSVNQALQVLEHELNSAPRSPR